MNGSSNLSKSPSTTSLVLIGGGHAHVQVLKALHKKNIPNNIEVTLIDSQKAACYSGMIPGCVAKLYTPSQTLLELEPLCDWAGIKFINKEVIDIDNNNNCIYVRDNNNNNVPVPFDIVSFDIGCRSRDLNEIPGALQHTIPTRPISKLVERIDEAEKSLLLPQDNKNNKAYVVVVGGGAAGIELAMCMRGRWGPILGDDNLEVTILNSGIELLSHESLSCRLALKKVLKDRKINIRSQCTVREVTSSHLLLENGDRLAHTHCLWATGAGAHMVLAQKLSEQGIDISSDGWITVNDYLQSTSHSNIFAAGDCCTIIQKGGRTPPKAGVYAVRSGPILVKNLMAYHHNHNQDSSSSSKTTTTMEHYKPQDDFLKLLACGDGTALGFKFGIPFQGKWVFDMKDHIDQMFMNLFRKEYLVEKDDNDTAGIVVSEYDAQGDNYHSSRILGVLETAELLQGKDNDEVNYLDAWYCLRKMAKDETYRLEVLNIIRQQQKEEEYQSDAIKSESRVELVRSL